MSEGKNNKESGSGKVAYISLVISIAAFFVSTFQAYETREHDHASVKPLIAFIYAVDERAPTVGLSIENDGLGPAIIKSLTIYIDGKRVADWGQVADNAKLNRSDISMFNLERDTVLKVGESQSMFSRSTMNKADLPRFIRLVDQNVAVSVTYCSIDDECKTKCSSDGRC